MPSLSGTRTLNDNEGPPRVSLLARTFDVAVILRLVLEAYTNQQCPDVACEAQVLGNACTDNSGELA